ncbi:hypothetical protein OHV48_06210 [Acinetobacter baumannii]|nr:hypothetical protein [Acinetobacter baumannii]
MFYDYFMSFVHPNRWAFTVVALFIAFAFVTCPIEHRLILRIKLVVCLGLLLVGCVLSMLPDKEFFYFYFGQPNI